MPEQFKKYEYFRTDNGTLYHGDCLDVMRDLPNGSIDMILCDLPYGTTKCKWDSVISCEPLWEHYKRITKENAAIVLTAAQPFTSALIMSNVKMFKYDWVWIKEKGTGHLNAKKMPMRDKEDVVIFYKKQPVYNPQLVKSEPYDSYKRAGKKQQADVYNKYEPVRENNSGFRYPKQSLRFNSAGRGGLHPTQKPIALFEYFIKTYTNETDTVLDNCIGSGTTAVACENLNRRWIGIEQEEKYCQVVVDRLDNLNTNGENRENDGRQLQLFK